MRLRWALLHFGDVAHPPTPLLERGLFSLGASSVGAGEQSETEVGI